MPFRMSTDGGAGPRSTARSSPMIGAPIASACRKSNGARPRLTRIGAPASSAGRTSSNRRTENSSRPSSTKRVGSLRNAAAARPR